MKVFVTGGTGLAGSHTIRALLDGGHEVRALVRTPAKFERVFADDPAGLEPHRGDIGDRESIIDGLRDCDAVVHAAAIVQMRNDDPNALIEANFGGMKNVLESALDAGIERIVDVSTLGALFRVEGERAVNITPDTEPVDSPHAYGRSKAMAERWIREHQAKGAPIWTTYPSAVLAPDDPGMSESTDALRILCGLVPVSTTGFQLVDARDLGVAHRLLLEHRPDIRRHLVPGHYLPWGELADTLHSVGVRTFKFPMPAPLMRGIGAAGDWLRRVAPALPSNPALTSEAMLYVTRWTPVDSSPQLEALGLHYRPARETLRDTTTWLRAAGHIR